MIFKEDKQMANDAAATQEDKITLTAEQLEGIFRKVVREELMEFATHEVAGFNLNKEPPLYEDMEEILERKQSGKLRFHTHEETWSSVGLIIENRPGVTELVSSESNGETHEYNRFLQNG